MTDAALRSYCLEVATKAAKNTQSALGELLHRTKAQAYLRGKLARRFPNHPPEQLQAVITALKLEIHRDDPDHDYSATPPRKPTNGREACAEPCWGPRVAQLVELVDAPLESGALLLRAHSRLGWQRNFTIQTLAAAELAGLLEWSNGAWWLPVPEQQAEQPEPVIAEVAITAQPEDQMTVLNAESPATETSSPSPAAAPAPAPAPAAQPPAEPTETREERKRRKKREWLQRQRAAQRSGASAKSQPKPKPRPPTPAAPAAPVPLPAAASLDAILEQRVRELVRAEIRAELAKTLGELVGKVLAA